jgi:hypothetical protein
MLLFDEIPGPAYQHKGPETPAEDFLDFPKAKN